MADGQGTGRLGIRRPRGTLGTLCYVAVGAGAGGAGQCIAMLQIVLDPKGLTLYR